MSMRFRITESPFRRGETPINPDTKVDGFPPLQHEPCIQMRGSQSKWDGRRPPHLAICASAWLEQRVRMGPLAISRHAPSLTASDGLPL
jgi:hypothetical protein